jgi:hypothetical protein
MAKLQSFTKEIRQEDDVDDTAAMSLCAARKRVSRMDDFGLTAAQRKMQLKALKKMQSKVDARSKCSDTTLKNLKGSDRAVKTNEEVKPLASSVPNIRDDSECQGSGSDVCPPQNHVGNSMLQASPRSVMKAPSKYLDWPSVAHGDALCQAGCENSADAHFGCSHDFCNQCLSGIRRHQKKKKSDSQKL